MLHVHHEMLNFFSKKQQTVDIFRDKNLKDLYQANYHTMLHVHHEMPIASVQVFQEFPICK